MTKTNKIRQPAVAGKFYPSSKQELTNQIRALIDKDTTKTDIIACLLPHAGYEYSGAVAAKTVSCINIKKKIILLGPNHTGYGAKYSIMVEGLWQTPLGEVGIDSSLAQGILTNCKYLKADNEAHLYEHSLEVELPFLQYFRPDFEIVPIIFLSDDLHALQEIGKEIGAAVKEHNLEDSVMIIASSDMTHYEPQEQAQKKDKEALQAILELNEVRLMERIQNLDISMCGYAPAITMLSAAKMLGAKNARLIKYQTSGDITGDKSSVVGYAGIIIY